MLVRAKMNVRDGNGWHAAGTVFDTDADLGDAVEVLGRPKAIPEAEPVEEPEKATEKPKSTSRRKKISG